MSFLVKVTHPWHQHSVSTEYAPKEFSAETPEDAAVLFRQEAAGGVELNQTVERLADGRLLKHEDEETGRTVTAHNAIAEVGELCTLCQGPYRGTPGWRRTTAGLLCPDCTVMTCPDHSEPVEQGAVVGS